MTGAADDAGMPPGLDELARRLDAIAFEPRASLEAEIAGRMRRREPLKGGPARRPLAHRGAIAAGVLAIALGTAMAARRLAPATVTVDRCCFDLDGGGDADDGVVARVGRDNVVRWLSIYEDADRSGALSRDDIVRYSRDGRPMLREGQPAGLSLHGHCCLDLDGGGLADDGVVVVGLAPDRIVAASVYERER